MMQQNAFLSLVAFGRTFLTNYRDLDKAVPGIAGKLTTGTAESFNSSVFSTMAHSFDGEPSPLGGCTGPR